MAQTLEEFFLNHARKHEIGPDEEGLMLLAGGVTDVAPNFEEDSEDFEYYDGEGGKEKVVTGSTASYEFSGHRKYRNEAQEFVRDKLFKTGERGCYFKVTEPDGRVIEGEATISDITPHGGAANEREEFTFSVTFVGVPKDTAKEEAGDKTRSTKQKV